MFQKVLAVFLERNSYSIFEFIFYSPEEQELSESIQTLRLGQRARDIELRPSKSQGNATLPTTPFIHSSYSSLYTQDSTNILLRRQISFLRQQLAYERSGSK